MIITKGRELFTGKFVDSGYTIKIAGQHSIKCLTLSEAKAKATELLGYSPKWEKLIRLDGSRKRVEYHIAGEQR